MALIPIPYQPLSFNTFEPTDCEMCSSGYYSFMVQPDDVIYWQGKQSPCGGNIVCDGTFSSVTDSIESICDTSFNDLSAEELVNGTFTGSASGWSLSTFVYGTNNISTAGGSISIAAQTLSAPTPQNAIYKVVFTVSGYGAGILNARIGTIGSSSQGANVTANGTYTQYLKADAGFWFFEFITNAAFVGTIDNVSVRRIAACWEFEGNSTDGWSIDSSGKAYTIASGVYGNTTQNLAMAIGIVPNTAYNITVHIADGSGQVRFGVGGTASLIYNLTGGAQTISFTITSGVGTSFNVNTQWSGVGVGSALKITDISAETIDGECWDFETANWVVTENAICHIPGTTVDTLVNIPTVPGATYYQMKVTVFGRTQGGFNVQLNGLLANYTTNYTDNGTFVFYFQTSASGQLSIIADGSFDGCISNVELFALKKDYAFILVTETGDDYADLTGFVNYFEDFVTLKVALNDPNLLNLQNFPIEYGCYKLQIFDSCEIQYDEIITDGEFLNPINTFWISDGDPTGTETIGSGQITFTQPAPVGVTSFMTLPNCYNGYTGGSSCDNPLVPDGPHNYRVSFDVVSNDDPTNITARVMIGGVGAYYSPANVGHYSVDINGYSPGQRYFSLQVVYATGASGTIVIDNVSAYRIEPFDETYTSPTIKYAESFKCTQYIQAYADAPQMGFEFENTGFKLGHRLNCKAVNPTYPEDVNDYLYSTGLKTRNFGASEKKWTLLIGPAPEWTHDAIRLQKILQYFEIQIGQTTTFQKYIPESGDYVPEWIKTAEYDLAPSQFDITLQDRASTDPLLNSNNKFFRNT